MDVAAAARFQGPGLRAQALIMVGVIAVGACAIATLRIAREGVVDGFVVFWLTLAAVSIVSATALELLTNRALARAAQESQVGAVDFIVLFRYAALTSRESSASTTVNKGWLSARDSWLEITAFRGREVIRRRRREDIATVEMISAPKAYSVLVITFASGEQFEAIPVEPGVRNMGFRGARAEAVVARVRGWLESRPSH